MKKVFYSALLAGSVILASCGNDDEEPVVNSSATEYNESSEKVDHDGDDATAEKDLVSVTVVDHGEGTGTTTWTNDKVYHLDGAVFVNDGQTLTIEAGTVIKGEAGQGENASALIVAKGGKIMAEGTSSMPIIFTSAVDATVRYADGTLKQGDNLNSSSKGLWGGLIVLGKAQLNSSPGETAVEGIPASETRGLYGGSDDADNSGSIKYISIRYGGTDIGEGNEINGLTLGGVGSGTTIEHVEVFANKDDGIEFFGGTANVKWAVTAYCGDDSYDYDEGYRGNGQFWVTIQGADSDRGGEHDGGTDPETAEPYATPTVYNATYIGNGSSRIITFRDNAGGYYHNCVFHNFGKGIDVEDLASGEDSRNRLETGGLKLDGNIISMNAATNTIISSEEEDLSAHANVTANTSVDVTGLTSSNPVPTVASEVSGATAASDSWFTSATYKGAFDPAGSNWLKGWTALDEQGLLD